MVRPRWGVFQATRDEYAQFAVPAQRLVGRLSRHRSTFLFWHCQAETAIIQLRVLRHLTFWRLPLPTFRGVFSPWRAPSRRATPKP